MFSNFVITFKQVTLKSNNHTQSKERIKIGKHLEKIAKCITNKIKLFLPFSEMNK